MCLSIIYLASHSLLSFFFITVKVSLSFFHSFIHSLINLVFIVLLSIKYWIYRNRNNTSFVFLELIKWGTETSKPTQIVHVKCYSGCMQDKRIVGRGDDAGKCEHTTEEGKAELNPEVLRWSAIVYLVQ